MNLEIKKDSIYTFDFTKINKNIAVDIVSATIQIDDPDGVVLMEATAMSICDNVASYMWDSADEKIKENYIVKFVIDGECYNRFFDIYCFPFLNTVIDDNLFAKDKSIKDFIWRVSGKANSGTVNTLIDTNRIEAEDHFNGGVIDLFYEGKTERRNITDFVNATNTIHFLPVVSVAVSENLGYAARESFQDEIDEAGKEVQERFNQIKKRAYLLIDHTQFSTPIIHKTLENFWRRKIKEEGDEFDLKYRYYQSMFNNYFTNMVLKYDKDADCLIEAGEEEIQNRIVFHR